MGFYGGNPDNVLNSPVDVVIGLLNYNNFEDNWLEVYKKLNEKTDG